MCHVHVCMLLGYVCYRQVLRAPLFAGLDWQALASGQLSPPFVPPLGSCAVSAGTSYAALSAYSEAAYDPEPLPKRMFGYSRGHGSDSQLLLRHASPSMAMGLAEVTTTDDARTVAAAEKDSAESEPGKQSRSIDCFGPNSDNSEHWSMGLPVVPLSPALAPGLLQDQQPQIPHVTPRIF